MSTVYRSARLSLLTGFRITAALLAVGLILALVRGQELSEETTALEDIPAAIFDGKATGFIDSAIVMIILTPVITSLVVALAFARIKDRLYTGISLIVLGVLSVSLALAVL